MALQLGALREALMHPGDAERAERAAEEVAGYENRLAGIENKLVGLMAGVGIMTALMLGLLWQTFSLHAQLADVAAATRAIQAALALLPK
jgi:hypothetical protein